MLFTKLNIGGGRGKGEGRERGKGKRGEVLKREVGRGEKGGGGQMWPVAANNSPLCSVLGAEEGCGMDSGVEYDPSRSVGERRGDGLVEGLGVETTPHAHFGSGGGGDGIGGQCALLESGGVCWVVAAGPGVEINPLCSLVEQRGSGMGVGIERTPRALLGSGGECWWWCWASNPAPRARLGSGGVVDWGGGPNGPLALLLGAEGGCKGNLKSGGWLSL